MTREEMLTKAAGHLTEYARCLRESNTVDGKWPLHDASDARAKEDHDEMVQLSAGLLAMATPA